MTLATYTSDLTDIFLFQVTAGVSAYGGGGAGLGTGADFAMEGTLAVDKQITNAEKGFLFDNVSNFTIGADDHFFIWVMGATPGICDTRDNRGIVGGIGDDTSNFVKFHLHGSDTLPLGGGRSYALRYVNTTLTNFRTLVGTPGTTPSQIGGGLSTTATAKAANLGVDGARIGTGYDILHGTSADPEANFAGIAADDEGTSEGIFQTAPGGYTWKGKLRIGDASNPCEFLDSDATLNIEDTRHSLTDFTEMILEHASSILTLTRITFNALGTNNPGRFEMITSAATADLTSCTFNGFGVTILGTGATFDSCTWINADIITANGADLSGSEITGFEGTTDTSALLWNTSTDPNGLLDSMTFTKGTAATHAIEFTASAPLTMTLQAPTFNGYNVANGNNDSTFLFADRGSDVTWTVNIVAGTGNFSYKKARAGDTVNVSASVSVQIKAQDKATDPIQDVRISMYLKADDSEILNADSNASGITSGSFSGSTPAAIYWRCRKGSSADSPKYIARSGVGTITSDGFDLLVTMDENPNNNA